MASNHKNVPLPSFVLPMPGPIAEALYSQRGGLVNVRVDQSGSWSFHDYDPSSRTPMCIGANRIGQLPSHSGVLKYWVTPNQQSYESLRKMSPADILRLIKEVGGEKLFDLPQRVDSLAFFSLMQPPMVQVDPETLRGLENSLGKVETYSPFRHGLKRKETMIHGSELTFFGSFYRNGHQ